VKWTVVQRVWSLVGPMDRHLADKLVGSKAASMERITAAQTAVRLVEIMAVLREEKKAAMKAAC
jgi:hypothetical protein